MSQPSIEADRKTHKRKSPIILGSIILLITIASIIFSILIYQITDEANTKQYYGLTAQELSVAWGAKNDDLRILRSLVNNGASLQDPDLLKQTYEYYLDAKSFLNNQHFPPQAYLDTEAAKINNFGDYDISLGDQQSTYAALNTSVTANINDMMVLSSKENAYFAWLIIMQIINAVLGIILVKIS